jgi:GMP synthase (glutamine-hydrolysing)
MSNIEAAPRILVIVHDVDDNLNELAVPLAEAGMFLETWDVQNDMESIPSLESLETFSGMISLGAHAGVQEESKHAWMQHERKLMERALELELPLFGFCFGAQLLASVAGGTFKPSPVAEIGWTRVKMAPEAKQDPIFGEYSEDVDAFHFHYDSFDLPDSVAILGETNGITQAFRVGNSAWATQFHTEVGLSTQLGWMTSYKRFFAKEGLDVNEHIRKSHELWRSYQDQAYRTATAFAKQVQAFHDANRV